MLNSFLLGTTVVAGKRHMGIYHILPSSPTVPTMRSHLRILSAKHASPHGVYQLHWPYPFSEKKDERL